MRRRTARDQPCSCRAALQTEIRRRGRFVDLAGAAPARVANVVHGAVYDGGVVLADGHDEAALGSSPGRRCTLQPEPIVNSSSSPTATLKPCRDNFNLPMPRANSAIGRSPMASKGRYVSDRSHLTVLEPTPLNARQEAFARNIAEGRSQREKASGPARVKSSTRHPSPHKSSGRKSNRRGVQTRRRCG
jgi:hypothetical protein